MFVRILGQESFPGVIRLHFAGGRFPQEWLPELRQVFPQAAIFNNYGCTEALPRLTVRPAEDADSASDVGMPIPGVELKTGNAGELLFRSEYRCVAQIELTGIHPVGDEEWLPTGDLGQETKAGRWSVLGRTGDVFKRYGEKISMQQILTSVTECWAGEVAHYREKDRTGEDGYVLVLSPAASQNELQSLLQSFRSHHPRTHWPLRIEGVDTFPQLPNGKVDVQAIRAIPTTVLHWRQRI
jgi:long-chain acyl-CoA synthetase